MGSGGPTNHCSSHFADVQRCARTSNSLKYLCSHMFTGVFWQLDFLLVLFSRKTEAKRLIAKGTDPSLAKKVEKREKCVAARGDHSILWGAAIAADEAARLVSPR